MKMDLYKNRYRIPSSRLQNWDYSNNGAYFITICTKNRNHYFGEIDAGEMQLNPIGKIAEKYWLEIPNHFPFVELGNFVIMPNHTHGILIVNNPDRDDNRIDRIPDRIPVETRQCLVSTTQCLVSTDNEPNKTIGQMRFQNQGKKSISSIVGSYKSVVTKNIRLQYHADFEWQDRFHDHIIRNEQSFERIQQYISNNPANWKDDRFNS